MKKYFLTFAAIALLAMASIYFAPNKKLLAHSGTNMVANTTPAVQTQPSNTQSAPVTDTSSLSATSQSTSTTGASSTTSSNSTSASYKDGSYTGSTASTPFGDVQVAITVSGGKITDVNFLNMPNSDGHSRMVSSYASPELKSQTISAQSANIDGVSGATYTSQGYMQSLQSAIDAAHI